MAGSKLSNLLVRTGSAVVMAGVLFYAVWRGHRSLAAFIVLLTCMLFNELVNAGMREANAERELPLYRTLQWLWFFVAMLGAYCAEFMKAPMYFIPEITNTCGDYLGDLYEERMSALSSQLMNYRFLVLVLVYSTTFAVTVMSLKPSLVASQIRILAFMVLALSLFVVQLKVMIYNVFSGIFWFIFPLLLVALNDSFAYFAGVTLGRKIINMPLLELSPKKSWEGFIGGGIATLVAGFYLPRLLLNSNAPYLPYLTCSFESYRALGNDCPIPPVFTSDDISYHGLALAAFASLLAPFGGFFASAIKRAYGLKDFANWIPGHGGLMDRLDCQFLMALYTWAHIITFVATLSPEGAMSPELLSIQTKAEMLSSSELKMLLGTVKTLIKTRS